MAPDYDGNGERSGAGAERNGDASAGDREDVADRGELGRSLASDAMPESVACPFCDGTETEQFSAFGSAVSVGQYYCRECRTVFEWMKWRRRD